MKRFNQILTTILLFIGAVAANAQEVRTYYVTDAVGSPVMAMNAYANVTWSEDYLPYGERRANTASAGDNERWFTGAPQNKDTGLLDLGNRQYDPVIGRFLSIDPVGILAENAFSVNRYAYSNNNPYRYIDPSGNIPVDTIWDAGNVLYDLGKVTIGWSIGNKAMVAEGLGDAALDTAAMFIPYVPAGSTKVARMGAKAADEAVDVGKVASRPTNFRKQTVQNAWDNAAPGSKPGTKACPTCTRDAEVAPGQGRRDWDVDHQPKWKDRDITDMNRKEVLDEYNRDVRLRCPACNRGDN